MKRHEAFAPVALTSADDYAKLFHSTCGRELHQYITVEGVEFYRTMSSPSSPTKVADRLEILRLDALNAIRVFIDRANLRQETGIEGTLHLSDDFTEYVSSSWKLPTFPSLRLLSLQYDGVTVEDDKKTMGPVFVAYKDLDEMEEFRIVKWLESNAYKLLCMDRWDEE